jgi:hypothetical protein
LAYTILAVWLAALALLLLFTYTFLTNYKGIIMNINTENMCSNEIRKIGLLLNEASRLGMDLGGYGETGVNQSNGNVYLWLEDYPFALFIDLGSDDIQACWTDSNNGNEEFTETTNMSLNDLYQWVEYNEAVAVD